MTGNTDVKTVASISVGDELLVGESLDTHGRRIASAVRARGGRPVSHRVVGDDVARIESAIRAARIEASLVIVTGGLGPTLDDVSREGLAAAIDVPLVEDAEAVSAIERWFAGRSRPMPPTNRRQALRPSNGRCLPNANGTAPGVLVEDGDGWIALLPGPPRELEPMLAGLLEELLPAEGSIPSVVVRAHGIGESDAAGRIETLMRRDAELPVATTVSDSILSARIRGRTRADRSEVESLAARVESVWSPYVFGRDDLGLEEALGRDLRQAAATVATAESCTGGGVATAITAVPGSSAWFLGGFATYANRRKVEDLGVDAAIIERDGAVSRRVAEAMAIGARLRTGSDLACSTTGIAGPDGGTRAKPVGTVWIGIADEDGVIARRYRFPGDRSIVRRRTVLATLQLLRFRIARIEAPLLWEATEDGAS